MDCGSGIFLGDAEGGFEGLCPQGPGLEANPNTGSAAKELTLPVTGPPSTAGLFLLIPGGCPSYCCRHPPFTGLPQTQPRQAQDTQDDPRRRRRILSPSNTARPLGQTRSPVLGVHTTGRVPCSPSHKPWWPVVGTQAQTTCSMHLSTVFSRQGASACACLHPSAPRGGQVGA